jgi:hypothetical protein
MIGFPSHPEHTIQRLFDPVQGKTSPNTAWCEIQNAARAASPQISTVTSLISLNCFFYWLYFLTCKNKYSNKVVIQRIYPAAVVSNC